MADTDSKQELSKEVLAPAAGIREDLVSTAVKFLQNPKVHQSPLSQKKAFLQRKGLTAEEIDIAVGRAGVPSSPDNVASPQIVAPGQPVPGPVVAAQAQPVSRWVKARDVMAVITMVTGVSYAAYRLYKEIIAPWLFGLPSRDQRLQKLEQMVTDSLSKMNTTLVCIEDTLGKQQEKLQILSHDVNSKTGAASIDVMQNTSSITEIKTELSSIKGLLLSRRQFPPVPATSPIQLPAWQLASNSGDANSNNKGAKDDDETTNTVTFSSSPASETEKSVKNLDNDGETTQEAFIIAKNSADLDNDQKEADTAERETEGQTSEVKVTEDANDSEGNESLD